LAELEALDGAAAGAMHDAFVRAVRNGFLRADGLST
jgi:hypothetical protein